MKIGYYSVVYKELINRVRAQDQAGIEKLFTDFRPMVYKIVGKFDVSGDYRLDREDLLQEAYIALYKAALEYVDNRGAQFPTFAYTVMYRAVLKSAKRYCRIYASECKSIDGDTFTESWEGFATPRYYDSPVRKFEYDEMVGRVKTFLNDLSLEESTILSLRQQDMSYRQISEQLGVSVKHVDYVLQKIKKRVQKDVVDY